MPLLMSFVLEPEIVTLAWIDNASVQFPLNIYATRGFTQLRWGLKIPRQQPRVACSSQPWAERHNPFGIAEPQALPAFRSTFPFRSRSAKGSRIVPHTL